MSSRGNGLRKQIIAKEGLLELKRERDRQTDREIPAWETKREERLGVLRRASGPGSSS